MFYRADYFAVISDHHSHFTSAKGYDPLVEKGYYPPSSIHKTTLP